MIKEKIKDKIKEILAEMGVVDVKIELEIPSDLSHGDYSSNIALRISPQLKKSPIELAQKLVQNLGKVEGLEKIEVAKPGFINFWIDKKTLLNLVEKPKSNLEIGSKLKNKKIVVEYTDPNPFKEFHIGHLYSNAVGESLSRLLESQGAEVWRADYFGDVGMHVANSIWGLLQKLREDKLEIDDLASWKLEEIIKYFGQAYAKGATAYKEDPKAQEEIKELNFLIFKAAQEVVLPQFKEKARIDYDKFVKNPIQQAQGEGKYEYEIIKHIYELGRKWSLAYFEELYKRLGTKFNGYYPESRTGEYGYGMVLEGLEKGIFEKGDGGAIIFPGSKYGLHERVFINSLGLPTYETKDFGNAVAKQVDFPYDKSIVVSGNEINQYFHVVIKALSLFDLKLGEKTMHIGHGMVRLPSGKISSRTGNIISGVWVLDEAKKKVQGEFTEMSDKVAEQVAVGAVKYALLKTAIGKDIEFSFEESISLSGNSGPYLQYTYARTRSVLGKKQGTNNKKQVQNLNLEQEEEDLLRILFKFNEVVEKAADEYAPHVLCSYLFTLAQAFNLFYQKHKIIGSEEEVFRIKLTEIAGETIKNGLHLLGIEAPQSM